MNKRKGFTLVEVIVILAVISILVGIAVPVALRIFERTAEDATREEMDNIKKAIIGDLRKLQNSFRSDFGFLGDIGCLPDDLRRIFRNDAPPLPSSLPSYVFDSAKQAGAGWKGPYITGSAGEEFDKDQWGNAYTYTPAGGACPLTADLTSSGASISLTSDDITLSIVANETTATVIGSVKDKAGSALQSVPVEFYSPVSGTLTTTTNFPPGTDANGNYSFSSVPFGPRAVRALPRIIYAPGSVSGTNTVTFTIINYSTAQTIDRMMVNFGGGGTYNRIRLDTGGGLNNIYNNPAVGNGVDVNVTDTLIAASPVAPANRPSMRVFVDSPSVQVPDTIITGQGTTAIMEIRFQQGMGGTQITVTINPSGPNPTSVFYFTP